MLLSNWTEEGALLPNLQKNEIRGKFLFEFCEGHQGAAWEAAEVGSGDGCAALLSPTCSRMSAVHCKKEVELNLLLNRYFIQAR